MKHVAPQTAIRRDNHKLIWELDSGRTYLYDLDLDLSETTDLSRFRPQVAASLHEELKAYLAAVGTPMPTHNPDIRPGRGPGAGVPGAAAAHAGYAPRPARAERVRFER